jgi:hypothetical protein
VAGLGLVVVLLTMPTGAATSSVAYRAPYNGFTAIRYVHSGTTGGNLTCGVTLHTPAPGRTLVSSGEERVKVLAYLSACGGQMSSFNYSGRLGLASPNFTVPTSGTYRFGSDWQVGYKVLINVTSPYSNASIWASIGIALHIELVNRSSGATFASTIKPIWNGSLTHGQAFTILPVHRKYLDRSGVSLQAGVRYEIKAYLQFYLAGTIQPWVAHGSGAVVWLDMGPSRIYSFREARLLSVGLS